MSITTEALNRFWKSMGQRYGKKWLDSYGDIPTRAWRDALAPFSHKDIARAMENLAAKASTREWPPTEPEFRAMLQDAVRANSKPTDDPNELRRGYWRSTIIHEVASSLGYTFETFEPVLIANRDELGASMRYLLDEVEDLETNTGQRTHGIEGMCAERCHDIGRAFKHLARVAA